jgi:hypothetical protein
MLNSKNLNPRTYAMTHQDLTPPVHVNLMDYNCFVLAASERETVPAPARCQSRSLPKGLQSDGGYTGHEVLDWSGFQASLRNQLRRFMQVTILTNAKFLVYS